MLHREIALSNGLVAKVDSEDFERLNQHSWYRQKKGHVWYVCRMSSGSRRSRRVIYMHREILGSADLVDHVNGDGLDNRKENLRPADKSKNAINSRKRSGTSSRFKGVSYSSERDNWQAYINHGGRRRGLGRFSTEVEAALAYNKKAIELFGEFAILNNVSEEEKEHAAQTQSGSSILA